MVVDRKKSKKKPHQIYISFPNAKIYVSYHILDSRAENFSNPMHILYQKVKKIQVTVSDFLARFR